MATKRHGRHFRLMYDTNKVGGSGASWSRIPLARELNLPKSASTSDGSTVEDDGWTSDVMTDKAWSVSGTACFDPGDPVHAALEAALETDTLVYIQKDMSLIGGQKKEGAAFVTKWDLKVPKNSDYITVDFEFKMQGPAVISDH